MKRANLFSANGRRAMAVALVAMAMAALLTAGAISSPTASAAQTVAAAVDSPRQAARSELKRLPSTVDESVAKIRHTGLRKAVQDALGTLKRLSEAKDPKTEQMLWTRFENQYNLVIGQTTAAGYQTCTFKCKSDTSKCQSACTGAGKKFCGCKLAGFGCFVAECVLG